MYADFANGGYFDYANIGRALNGGSKEDGILVKASATYRGMFLLASPSVNSQAYGSMLNTLRLNINKDKRI